MAESKKSVSGMIFRALRPFLTVMLVLVCTQSYASPRMKTFSGPLTGEVLNVLDGDTVSVRIQIWIDQDIETHVRIAGIDTPEMKGSCKKERALAQEAQKELKHLLESGIIRLHNIRYEKYAGRVMAEAVTENGINIREYLIAKGFARPYQGKKRESWCS